MNFDVRVLGVRRSDTLSPGLNACAVVSAAARVIVNVSPLRAVHSTTSIVVPAALASVSSMLPPKGGAAIGLGKLSPSPACTLSDVASAARGAASVDETGENAKSSIPR